MPKNPLYIILIIGLGILCGCAEDNAPAPIPPTGNAKVSVTISTIPSVQEGYPDIEYSFTAIIGNKPNKIRLDWYFDDSVQPISTNGTETVKHTFSSEGRFFVTVVVYELVTNKELARTVLLANIRKETPRIDMVLIPAGSFLMGKQIEVFESPQRLVTISKPFLIGITEITQQQWQKLMGYNPSWFIGDSLPIESVSWFEAVRFCNSLSIRENKEQCYTFVNDDSVFCDFSKNGYRLPTEMEWEYAARGGANTDTPTGNLSGTTDGCLPLDIAIDQSGWYCGNVFYGSMPVAKKTPNTFGLYDVIGNVQEWCWDWYDPYYYINSPTKDARGPQIGVLRSCRGGSWYNQIFQNRLAARQFYRPSNRTNNIGFRVARNAD